MSEFRKYRILYKILQILQVLTFLRLLYLHGLTRGSGHPGSHDGKVIHQSGTQEFLLYIHGCDLCVYCVTVVYSVYRTSERLNSPQGHFQLES